ncbi:hypothetical protein Mgra_00005615 [Meloidogyne graminicola]|uniref:S1 motif domain-containing protein n=1 Tax=Meloidogyne graminicola TaxID=189291 RepID=A0A8S9ZNC6_9BILA|nr:hypothetical protein Mgra_00005615 [Meloidogyne graminicola]
MSSENQILEGNQEIIFGVPSNQKKVMAVAADCFQQDYNNYADTSGRSRLQLTVPGALISSAKGLMRGHGTYLEGESLLSSLAGVVMQTNKLIRVKPVRSRYQGEIGDVIVGRIVDVQQKRWRVDINARLHSILQLTSVNLPGGELRRKSIEDEFMMREYLKEGDLVSAEVQQSFHDGALSLHTRSLKYGKLGQGILVRVFSHLVRKRKTHFHNLPFGVSVILGCNGNIWISRMQNIDEQGTGGYVDDTDLVPLDTREAIVRTANCIKLLARNSIPLYDTTIIFAYNASTSYKVNELLQISIADEVANQVIQQCEMSIDEDELTPLQI